MMNQSKGLCKYCGKEYTRGGMLRHLAACRDRKAVLDAQTGKRRCGYFELVIYGKYDSEYWLIVEARDTATLRDLDQFIRDIWVECCGHLSAFEINGEDYEAAPDISWGDAKSMNYKLKDVLEAGMLVGYEYDFGSTTELVIKVQGYREGVWKRDAVLILSRNQPPKIPCFQCGNPADFVLPERYYEEDAYRCRACLKKERALENGEEGTDEEGFGADDDYDEYYLPICNSPRMGVCGYTGSSVYPEVFVPDKT